MPTSLRGTARQYGVALRALLLLTIVLGVAYPLLVTGVGQTAFPAQANGSPVLHNGHVIGSSLIGQSFSDSHGTPLPQWFQPRPSAAGNGYDASASGGSNLGPDNPELLSRIRARAAAIEKADHVPANRIPADALTASGSGLDPDISPAYALLQVARVAAARALPVAAVRALVDEQTASRELGYLGEPTVNVLALNLALEKLASHPK
jgi:K+-transporting ATPase, C subunit